MADQEKHIVHKSNDLIEAKQKLSLIEQRILAICISKINPTKPALLNPYRFSIDEYCALAGSSSTGMHTKVKAALKTLQSRTLEKYDPDIGRTRYFNWTRKIDAWDSKSYDIYFDEEIEADLLAKTRYTEYLLRSAFSLNSRYALRLYEVAKQKKGQKQPPKFTVPILRTLLGVEDDKYTEYRDFKKRCFKPAVEEINQRTGLKIEFNEFRKKRQVDLVELIITDDGPKAPKLKDVRHIEANRPSGEVDLFELMADKTGPQELIDSLQNNGIQPDKTLSLINEFGEKKVRKGLEEALAEKSRGKLKGGVNFAGVIINKIKDPDLVEIKQVLNKENPVNIEVNRDWWNSVYKQFETDLWENPEVKPRGTRPTEVLSDPYCSFGNKTFKFIDDDFQDQVKTYLKSLTNIV